MGKISEVLEKGIHKYFSTLNTQYFALLSRDIGTSQLQIIDKSVPDSNLSEISRLVLSDKAFR